MPQKEVNSYVVLQRGGLVNGQVIRTANRIRVGAKTPKEAIQFCKEQVDKTAGYAVYYQEKNKTLPRGTVITKNSSPEPYVEHEGKIYISTDEFMQSVKETDNGPINITYQKLVDRYARKATDCIWIEVGYTYIEDQYAHPYI